MFAIKDKEREVTTGKGQCYGSVECNSCTTASSSGVERKYLMPKDDMEACSSDPLRKASWTDSELLFDEMTGMNKLAVPVILTYCLEMLPGILTIILVGRVRYDDALVEDQEKNGTYGSMQKLHLDAASMAIMVTNVVAMYPTIGMLTAMDSLCSQAYGANQPAKMGTYVLTALAVVSVILSVSSFIVWNTSDLLIALGQPVEVSQMTGDFIRYLLPGLPFVALYELIRKLFQSRNNATPMLRAALVCIAVNIGLGYYLVHWTDWGWMGPAVAKSAGNIASVAAALLGLGGRDKNHQCSDTQPSKRSEYMTQTYLDVCDESRNGDGNVGDDSEFLQHLWEGFVFSKALSSSAIFGFLSLGIPGMLQVMFQLVAFEVLALVCGRLPREQAIVGIGANSILMNISTLTYMMYIGVSVSGNVRIGNALGAGDAHRAEVASNLAIALAVLVALLNMVFLVATRSTLPWLFTMDLDIVRESTHLFIIGAAFQLPDAINTVCQEIFRASGRQALGAKWNFVAYYFLGLPLGYMLGNSLGFGVEGLWWGMTAALYAVSIGCLFVVLRSNWNSLAMEATLRLRR